MGLRNLIGLEGPPETPADEYDRYLIAASNMISAGCTETDVVAYLIQSAEETMGTRPADRAAAAKTAEAIRRLVGASPSPA